MVLRSQELALVAIISGKGLFQVRKVHLDLKPFSLNHQLATKENACRGRIRCLHGRVALLLLETS
jgi:hypothetical protein